MSVSIDDAVSEGLWRLLTPVGAGLLIVAYVLQFVQTWLAQSLQRTLLLEFFEGEAEISRVLAEATPLASDLPLPVIAVVGVGLWIVTTAFTLVVLRVFTGERSERFRPDHYVGLALPTINAVVGSIVFGIVVGIGFLFLFVPGIFLAVSLWFYQAVIAVEDENFVEALGTSWTLTSGNRLSVFAIALIVVVIGFVVNLGFGVVQGLVSGTSPIAGVAIGTVGSAFNAVFTQSVTARTFDQLREGGVERTRPEDLVEEDWS